MGFSNKTKTGGVLLAVMVFGVYIMYQPGGGKDYTLLSNSEILNTPIEELADLSLEDLMSVSDRFCFNKMN